MQIVFGIFLGVFVLSIIVLAALGLLVDKEIMTSYIILSILAILFIGLIVHWRE